MTADIRLTQDNVQLEADGVVTLQAVDAVVVASPDLDFQDGNTRRTAVARNGNVLVVNEAGDFAGGIRYEGGRYIFELPAGVQLPSMNIMGATFDPPPFDTATEIDLVQELANLRSEVFLLKMIVRHLIMPNVPAANITPGTPQP